ncbi:MMPL family transporter, partial [Planococcus sp. SIMBA_143]
QSFLIVILFGIGTDYCILLLNRFKEELEHHDKYDAIIRTFSTGGKTVFISGLSGAIVFGVLYFANFEIYRSAVGVALGVVFLLLSL